MAKDITVTFLNVTASEIGHPSSLDGISNMDFIENNKLLTYSGANSSSIFSSASSMSLPKGFTTTTVTRDRLIVGAVLHHELLQGCVPIRGFCPVFLH